MGGCWAAVSPWPGAAVSPWPRAAPAPAPLAPQLCPDTLSRGATALPPPQPCPHLHCLGWSGLPQLLRRALRLRVARLILILFGLLDGGGLSGDRGTPGLLFAFFRDPLLAAGVRGQVRGERVVDVVGRLAVVWGDWELVLCSLPISCSSPLPACPVCSLPVPCSVPALGPAHTRNPPRRSCAQPPQRCGGGRRSGSPRSAPRPGPCSGPSPPPRPRRQVSRRPAPPARAAGRQQG